MTAIKIVDLNNAKLDVDHMKELATSAELTATDRFGKTKKTWSGIEHELGAEYAETVTGGNRIAAEAAADLASNAAAAALAAGNTYTTDAQGVAATTEGQVFLLKTADPMVYLIRTNNAGSATPSGTFAVASDARLQSVERTFRSSDPEVEGALIAVADDNGNSPIFIGPDSKVRIGAIVSHEIEVGGEKIFFMPNSEWARVVVDDYGNIIAGVKWSGEAFPQDQPDADGGWTDLSLGTDDIIGHIGDSYTAAHYVLKDKAYISVVSALSPYRHVNYALSGNDALDMQYRVVNEISTLGTKLQTAKVRYVFITSLTNDAQYRTADLTFYAENIRRLVETVRALGPEPVITTEFPASTAEHALLRRIAQEMGCGFIDCTSYNSEIGGLQVGPFHQGHPGTRTGGVFALPMIDYIDRMPKPDRAIKIFRRRSTFAVSGIADLLYTGRLDRTRKWKELTLGHYSLTPESKFEELSQLGTIGVDWNYVEQQDEYQRLIAGNTVNFTDYGLIEVSLPGNASTLEAVEITLGVGTGVTLYARDYLDVAASLPGSVQGMTPTNPTYLSKWDKPRGAWRSLGEYSGAVTISGAQLSRSMQGNTLVLMAAGAFNLTAFKVRYKGREVRNDLRRTVRAPAIGAELLTQQLCGTSGQLSAWTVLGTVVPLVPIDLYNAPRKPGVNTPVDGVAVVRVGDTIGQSVVLPTETGAVRRYRITVWARHFPKAFLDPAKYPTLDTAQIVNRIDNPSAAPITSETNDLRTLKGEVWSGASYPTQGGAEFFDFAALQWRPVEFDVEVLPFQGPTLSFRLSCPDGEVQVAKVSFKEISA